VPLYPTLGGLMETSKASPKVLIIKKSPKLPSSQAFANDDLDRVLV
jgi:hypothetical protein